MKACPRTNLGNQAVDHRVISVRGSQNWAINAFWHKSNPYFLAVPPQPARYDETQPQLLHMKGGYYNLHRVTYFVLVLDTA